MNKVRFRAVAAFVWRYWWRSRGMVGAAMMLILMATLCDAFLPLLVGGLIDTLVAAAAQPTADQVSQAVTALVVLVAVTACFHLCREVSYRFWIPVATLTMRRMACDAFARVQRFSADWHANTFAGSTVRKISRGLWAYDTFADVVYHGFLPAVVIVVGISANLLLHWPLMGLFVLLAVAVYVGVSVALAVGYISPANVVMNAADSEMGGALADAVSCNPTVKAFGAERREDRRFLAVAGRWQDLARHAWTREINGSVVQSIMGVLLLSGLLSLSLWYWAQGQASPGDVAFVLTSNIVINGYLRQIGEHVRHLQQSVNELQDLVAFQQRKPLIVERPGAPALRAGQGRIDLVGVGFGYGNQRKPIYRDFSLSIAAGERVALVGPSGSGKSTFVKLLQRLYDIDAGRILLDGQDIAGITLESLRQAIALVPQDPALFHRSLAENIAYGRPEATQAEIVNAAKRAHAHDFILRLPDGYDTLVGERGVKLSGGERQRVAIARAFLADAPVLVLDEATSSLDSITEAEIQDAIEALMEGRTTIVIAHRLSTVRTADRILGFEAGAIVEQGTHAELLARRDGRFSRLHAIQLAGLLSGEAAEENAGAGT
ncbi:MAG: ABC transporter ATP-binding protein [Kiloniellaceae bacterium]